MTQIAYEYDSFTDAYYDLLEDVYRNPEFICAPRGQKIYEKLGVRFTIKNPRARIPFIKERNFAVSYIIAEALWYFSGNDLTSWISYYSKFWEKISDDGQTANSAYGARIFRPHRRAGGNIEWRTAGYVNQDEIKESLTWNQWDWAIEELVRDNDSRRAVVHIRSPLDSRLAKLDVPCTLTLQFFLRDDKVHLCASMRSSDLWLGIANDVPAFTFFQELMAIELQEKLERPIGLGTYTHISNSLHIYERNFKNVEEVITASNRDEFIGSPMPKMPSRPPIQELLLAEQGIRQAMTVEEITRQVNVLSDLAMILQGHNDYWIDWVKVLAAHRCGKLEDKEAQKHFLNTTDWEGYGFFNR